MELFKLLFIEHAGTLCQCSAMLLPFLPGIFSYTHSLKDRFPKRSHCIFLAFLRENLFRPCGRGDGGHTPLQFIFIHTRIIRAKCLVCGNGARRHLRKVNPLHCLRVIGNNTQKSRSTGCVIIHALRLPRGNMLEHFHRRVFIAQSCQNFVPKVHDNLFRTSLICRFGNKPRKRCCFSRTANHEFLFRLNVDAKLDQQLCILLLFFCKGHRYPPF